MESDQACSSDVAPWWSHHSIIEEAEPLDATADDAAASCLSDIAKQTADHILAYRNNLLNLLGPENPARQDSAVHTSQHTGDANSSSLHQLMKWDSVLLPLLTQLRKCMARAWDERAAEEAQKAADDPTPAPAAVIGRGGTKATLYPHFDAVQARRLRVLQQQIYLAFLKAVLQGLADGARGAVATNAKASNAARAEEGNSTDAQDDKATETTNTALADRVLSALLDNLLTHILSCATAGSTKALPHIEDGEAAKPRRGLGRRAPAATGTHTGDWLSGMLPLYLRAAHQQHTHAHGGVAEQDGTVSAPAPAARIPSPALCLVSYIGAFVQGAGLQLSPSEQEAYLPCFTHKVHSEFRGELQRLVQASVAHTECTATSLARSDPAAIATTAAHIRYASDVVKTIVDTQLYCNENATEVDDDDCTMIYAALPRPPAPCAPSQLSEMPTEVDYSVAPLLTLTSYKVCEGLLRPLSHWWVACQDMVRHAGIFTALAVPSVDKDGKVGREQQQQQNDGPTNGNDTNLLAGVEEAWLGLRKQVMTLALVFSNYSETTLFIVPFMNLLTDIFFVSELAPPKQTPPPSEAWRCCVRELHRITHATHDGSHTLVAHAASGARRHLRVHHRHVRDCTFATACFSRVMECLSNASTGAHVPAAAAAAAAETDHQPHNTEPHNLMPLAFATLQQPLSVMQEHVFRVLLAVNSVTMDMRVDAVVRIKSVSGEHGTPADAPSAHPTMQPSQWPASGAATGSMCFKALTEEYLSAVQLVELYFPHHYRVFLALEEAMQYVLDRSQELASGSTVAEETGDGDKIASVWAAPFSLTPATLARFIGAVLDEACVARMRNTSDEVAISELFMFFAAVFRTLPSTVLPRLRSALETFLGEGGCSLIEYLRYHIVAQQHHGLAAFFLPPLRAMALDYTTAEDADVSLALTAKYPCSGAIAYLWEQPRLYFWQAEDTPVMAAAWHAQAAAQRYLCELVAPVSATATTFSTPFLDIVQSAAAVASERCAALLEKTKTAPGLLWTRGLAMDVMTSLFFGVCRWCALQLSASSSSSMAMAMATATPTPTAPLSAEAATMLIRYLCSPHAASVALSSANSAANSFLVSLRDRSEAQLESNSRVAAAEAKDIVVGKEYVEATNSPSNSSPPPTQQLPRSSSRRWLSWFWACGYDQVGTSVRVQTAAKRLLREFSAHCGSYAPTKTLLGIRAGVEQMKEGGAPDGEGALHDLREAVRGDLDALLQQQEQQQQEEEEQSLREKREDEKTAAVASTSNLQEVAMTTATATTTAAAAGAVLKPATLREYLDHIHEALVQRARISPIDGAISAATLGHLLHVLSDAQLPITMTVQERQRMCQRFFFTLANSLTECTRTEALSCLCCMRCVLHDIVLPYKKSFLIEASAARAFHCCLPDIEADAFRMVQHAFGDVVMAVQKMALRNSILDEWKIVLVLQHLGDTISLVRSVAEKLRGTVKKITSRRRGVAIDAMTQQLAIVEKSASCTKRGAADDIYRLFTLHPMPSPSPSTATSTKAVPAAATTAPLAAAAPVERSSSGRRNHSNHRERERRNEKDRKRSFDDGGRRGGGDDGGRRGGGGGGETSLKMPRRNDSKPHRSNFKRPRR